MGAIRCAVVVLALVGGCHALSAQEARRADSAIARYVAAAAPGVVSFVSSVRPIGDHFVGIVARAPTHARSAATLWACVTPAAGGDVHCVQVPTPEVQAGNPEAFGRDSTVVADLDADGEQELLLAAHYEGPGTRRAARFLHEAIWVVDVAPELRIVLALERRRYGDGEHDPFVGRWHRFRDVNGDGHPDVVLEVLECRRNPDWVRDPEPFCRRSRREILWNAATDDWPVQPGELQGPPRFDTRGP